MENNALERVRSDCSPRNNPARSAAALMALALALVISPAMARPATPFILQPSGFYPGMFADDQGRLIQDWPGQPRQLAPGHWISTDFDSNRSVWFDSTGRVSHQGPYVEFRSSAFKRHPQDPDQTPLFNVWSTAGTAVLRADGSTYLGWIPEPRVWMQTPHPQRYRWISRPEGEHIYDEKGRLRMQLASNEMLVAGPFPSLTRYLICDASTAAPCALRDEAGTTLWTRRLTDLLPLANGGFLGKEDVGWRRLDASGQPTGDRSLVYFDRAYWSGKGPGEVADIMAWPRWMLESRIGSGKDAGDALPSMGLMQSDGRFVAVNGAMSGQEVCPGIWRFERVNGEDQLGDANGRILGRFAALAWKEIDGRPEQRVAVARNGQETLIDCNGNPLVDTPPLIRISAEGTGLLGTLVDEVVPRLWLDADLQQHLFAEGSQIESASRNGAYLVVKVADHLRVYHVKRSEFVGAPFAAAGALMDGGVVFVRDGQFGFMDVDGIERVPPRNSAIMAWGQDRLWSTRYVGNGNLKRQVVSLHGIDGIVIKSWNDATVSDSPALRSLPDQGPVSELIGWAKESPHGKQFGQQWVDRDGRTLFLAMEWRDTSGQTEGTVVEPVKGRVRQRGEHYSIPDGVRAEMAPVTLP